MTDEYSMKSLNHYDCRLFESIKKKDLPLSSASSIEFWLCREYLFVVFVFGEPCVDATTPSDLYPSSDTSEPLSEALSTCGAGDAGLGLLFLIP